MPITIRPLRVADIISCWALVARTFQQFNSRDGTPEAVQRYIDSNDPEKTSLEQLEKNFLTSPLCFVATDGKKIIWLIKGRSFRINNLFVDGSYHRQGIGGRLLATFEETAKQAGAEQIKLRAAPYAVPFYLAHGYRKTTGMRNFHGLHVQPMKKVLINPVKT